MFGGRQKSSLIEATILDDVTEKIKAAWEEPSKISATDYQMQKWRRNTCVAE